MANGPNAFSYQNPMGAIGDSLARALFGDPNAAAAQAKAQQEADLRAAQAERERAAAGYDTARTAGVTTANAAQQGLPGMIEAWARAQQPAPPPPTMDSPEFANFDQPLALPAAPDKMGALAALIGSMGQMQGDKISPSEIMGTAASFAGGDELARRGLIAQGHSPTADFATTSGRADEIAGISNSADLAQALGVATINNRDDIPVAQIAAQSRENVALTNNRDDIPVAAIRAEARRATAARKPDKPPRAITPAQHKALADEVDDQLLARGLSPHPNDVVRVRTWASEEYQRTGNIVGAVDAAIDRARQMGRSNQQARYEGTLPGGRAAPTGPAAPAGGRSNFATPTRGPMTNSSSSFVTHQTSGPVRVKTQQEATALRPGTRYIRPDGVEMTR